MIEIQILRASHSSGLSGRVLRGHTVENIARRIGGRRGVVWYSGDPNAPADGTIGTRTQGSGEGMSVICEFRYVR